MTFRLDQIPTGEKIGNNIDETVSFVSGATTATTPSYTMQRSSAATNAAPTVLRLQHITSGSPAAGIGASLDFEVETSASNNEIGAKIEAVARDVTGASEDFDLRFSVMAAGSTTLKELLRLRADIAACSVTAWELGESGFAVYETISDAQSRTNRRVFWNNSTGSLSVASGAQLGFSATAAGAGAVSNSDTAIARNAAAVIRVTDGSTGVGSLLTKKLVEANTAGSGAPNVLVANETRTVLTNEGTTAENYHTLPTAVAGLEFEFVCQDADGIRIVANTDDTIRDGATASAAAGFIRSSTVGSTLRLLAINAVEWYVMSKQGTWTVDA